MSWSFQGTSFEPLLDNNATPLWVKQPRIDERHLLGTNTSEINILGSMPPRITQRMQVTTTSARDALLAANGTVGTLVTSAGSTSCLMVLKDGVQKFGTRNVWVLTADFIRNG